MLATASLPSVTVFAVPPRFDVDFSVENLLVRRLATGPAIVQATASAFRSRGDNCRRVLIQCADERQFVVEFTSFNVTYEPAVSGVIRADGAGLNAGKLTLENSRFRANATTLDDTVALRARVLDGWRGGIRYRQELLHADQAVRQQGLRRPQVGALHAIASHWTLGKDDAVIVMPTGTGKTEVMMAASIAASSDRVLVVVPTDALRSQTAKKFSAYGLLPQIGIIDGIENPVVGTLASKPDPAHFAAIGACNVVVSTMASIGLAAPEVQQQFAALFSHVLFDEAHHIEAATWKRFQKHCGAAHTLLFTATPFREDSKPVDGRIIYNFPLSAAQEQGYFKPIKFLEVFEPDQTLSDARIAEVAVTQLRADIAQGHQHLMMARVASIDDAERIFADIYAARYADLNPIVIHSRTRGKKSALERIRTGEHKIIVCVDMFGEGFDLPQLKVAALHCVHKSLGITLQFIGRFARAAGGVGGASFVANVANDGVPEALENLYREDADWNALLADFSYDAINPQAQLSDLISQMQPVRRGGGESPEISLLALRPKTSTQVYRALDFRPDNFAKAFRPSQKVHQPHISRRDNMLVLIVNQQETLDWTDSRDIAMDSWDLYIAYYNPAQRLLYTHCSRKGHASEAFAGALSTDPVKVEGEAIFKAFGGLERLVLYSVGLSSLSKNVRYQMFAGLDVGNAIDPVLQQDKMKSNITGVGYENGKRRSVGGSRKGKLWAMSSGSIAQWRAWCDETGAKLLNTGIQPNDFLRFTLVPSTVQTLPDVPALMADWPEELFESSNFKFKVHDGETTYDFHDCEVVLFEWTQGGTSFTFALRAGGVVEVVLKLTIEPGEGDRESRYTVERVIGPNVEIEAAGDRAAVAEFFAAAAPLVRLSDGSQLSGNILLRPREALPDTFDRATIRTLDWTGVDLAKESRWRDDAVREDSIQQHFIRHLLQGPATIIVDDDDSGESADTVAIEETATEVTVTLWHCKFAGGTTPGRRAKDLYEVCGQAQKSVKWTWNLDHLAKHLVIRDTKYARGRPTRYLRGSNAGLVTLRKAAKRKSVTFRIGIVQPGLSRANIPADHLAVIGATSSFIRCVTDHPLLVFGSV